MGEEMKRCQFCGEEILAIAKKCKHCGSNLEGIASENVVSSKPAADYGILLLAIPVVATMLIWFWVSGMNLLQSPGSTMQLILLATILCTAIVAAMEAGKVGMQSDKVKGTYGPTAWFFIISLLWVVGYPVYLFKRKHFGLANQLVGGILVALVFVGSWVVMNFAIEQQMAEVRGSVEQMQKEVESIVSPPQSLPVPQSPQPSKQEFSAPETEKFVVVCRATVKDNAIKLGGMSALEAERHAEATCNEYLPAFNTCMKRPTAVFDDCSSEAILSGE